MLLLYNLESRCYKLILSIERGGKL